jgi:hypothetical protein
MIINFIFMLLHQENHLKCPWQRAGNQLVNLDGRSQTLPICLPNVENGHSEALRQANLIDCINGLHRSE